MLTTARATVTMMSLLVSFLLLWGFTLGPVAEAAVFIDTRPSLSAKSESLLEPWANITLTCKAQLYTMDFELLKDGASQELVHLHLPTIKHQFLLTGDTRGLYRCRSGLGDDRWTQLSNLVEVTGPKSLPSPWLSAEPVPWITPGLNSTLVCHGGLQGVNFLLRRKGDDAFLEVAKAGENVEATFSVHKAGDYSCTYRTHAAGTPSDPSAPVAIKELAAPPPPALSVDRESAGILRPGDRATLLCVAPLSGVKFQLRLGEKELPVPQSSTNPDRTIFHLDALAPRDTGPYYTCRYRLWNQQGLWSGDSKPATLIVSNEQLPAPELSAEPTSRSPEPGTLVRLRCLGPLVGMRFVLVREDAGGRRVHSVLSPAGTEATFELRNVSVADSANYSCVYTDPKPPFLGSAPSASVELQVEGPPPRPRLRALWSGAVTPGRDAVLRCEGHIPDVTFELLRVGDMKPLERLHATHPSADLTLTYVGPQHAGNYSCRYRSWWPNRLESELSDPVQLLVAGH
ncbi:alpha-1B-glycoprotein isoform X1 [Nycticebus coucang]|uniref:alpha-1B-glycoprotein isoform X1 n=1 Tax=Nycticebus coucang TaxID=9470 RepID=UPI00234DD08B|nr:alpha-1B-glycoprotein isoform X1 [Nycticebus coucang]